MTKLIYIDNPDLFQTSTTVRYAATDNKGFYVVLEQSLFYPQGGGQPADCGTLSAEDALYDVYDVRYVDDEVRHYITPCSPHNLVNKSVTVVVDEKRRKLNTRYHTAGHLIANVAEEIAPELLPTKGHQFPESAYIEFHGMLKEPEHFCRRLTQVLGTLLDSEKCVETRKLHADDKSLLTNTPPAGLNKTRNYGYAALRALNPNSAAAPM